MKNSKLPANRGNDFSRRPAAPREACRRFPAMTGCRPGFGNRSPNAGDVSPAAGSFSPEIRNGSPDFLNSSPGTGGISPGAHDKFPRAQTTFPGVLTRSPDVQSPSPGVQSRSPGVPGVSPVAGSHFPGDWSLPPIPETVPPMFFWAKNNLKATVPRQFKTKILFRRPISIIFNFRRVRGEGTRRSFWRVRGKGTRRSFWRVRGKGTRRPEACVPPAPGLAALRLMFRRRLLLALRANSFRPQ